MAFPVLRRRGHKPGGTRTVWHRGQVLAFLVGFRSEARSQTRRQPRTGPCRLTRPPSHVAYGTIRECSDGANHARSGVPVTYR